jgi:hypothetical protein
MSRPCGWCVHPKRHQFEQRLAAGEPIAAVALDTGHSISAAKRHLRAHVAPALLGELRLGSQLSEVHLSDFTDRLVELADTTASLRAAATRSNDGTLLLRAVREEAQILSVLMDFLGIDSTEAGEQLRDAKHLAQAIHAVLPAHPDVSRQLADRLYEMQADNLASAIESLIGPTELAPVRAVRFLDSEKDVAL